MVNLTLAKNNYAINNIIKNKTFIEIHGFGTKFFKPEYLKKRKQKNK